METIKNNSDFLFIYEAINSNPNGDPDQENKPRMDYDTKTNLVTDVRVKRFIRDYLKTQGQEIFVDMEGDSKVSPDTRLVNYIEKLLSDESRKKEFFKDNPEMEQKFDEAVGSGKDIVKKLKDKNYGSVRLFILEKLVKERFIDIRMFGSAFAVEGFTRAYTGAIQLNWGYSLNKVELIDSSSIVTIMNDDSSTFGKDYRVYYSLLAFNGTINKHVAKTTGLTEDDLNIFRNAIWDSIPAMPTRSKLNQYPKLYVELVYKDDVHNGIFGDLRNYIETRPKEGLKDEQVRSFSDLVFDTTKLENLIRENKDKFIEKVIVKKSADIDFPENF